MNNKPLVSIIIPCYNQEKYLYETYESLKGMSYTNWECVIVDDGSTDSSSVIIKKIASEDSRVKLISKENGGTASARNLGIASAGGKFLQFLDADDKLDSEKIARQVSYMDENNLDISYTDSVHFCVKDEGVEYRKYDKWSFKIIGSLRFSLLTRWGIDMSIPMHCWMYKTSFIKDNVILFDEKFRYREDWNFHLLVSNLKPRCGRMSGYIAAYYRENPSSKTSSSNKVSCGNYIFLGKKASELDFPDFICWSYRTSCELWRTILRTIKHKDFSFIKNLKFVVEAEKGLILLMLAIIFLPISFVAVSVSAIHNYL